MKPPYDVRGLEEYRIKVLEELSRADSYCRDSEGKLQVHRAWKARVARELEALDSFAAWCAERNAGRLTDGEVSQARPDQTGPLVIDGETVLDIHEIREVD